MTDSSYRGRAGGRLRRQTELAEDVRFRAVNIPDMDEQATSSTYEQGVCHHKLN